MPRAAERAMLGCFPVARRPSSLTYEEAGSTSAASTSAGTSSPPASSASTSSPAFLDDDDDDDDALYLGDAGGLSTAIAGRRFFLASPGRSNSIVDSVDHPHLPAASLDRESDPNVRALRRAATSAFPSSAAASASSSSSSPSSAATAAASKAAPFRGDGMQQPVRKVSLSTDTPRAEFLKSMLEMVEALGLDTRRRDADLACLHDLLLCYIALNEREALRDILGAFADLMCLLDGSKDDAIAAATAAADGVDGGGEKKRGADVQGSRTARG